MSSLIRIPVETTKQSVQETLAEGYFFLLAKDVAMREAGRKRATVGAKDAKLALNSYTVREKEMECLHNDLVRFVFMTCLHSKGCPSQNTVAQLHTALPDTSAAGRCRSQAMRSWVARETATPAGQRLEGVEEVEAKDAESEENGACGWQAWRLTCLGRGVKGFGNGDSW